MRFDSTTRSTSSSQEEHSQEPMRSDYKGIHRMRTFANLGFARALLALCTLNKAATALTLTSIGGCRDLYRSRRLRNQWTVTSYTDTTLIDTVAGESECSCYDINGKIGSRLERL